MRLGTGDRDRCIRGAVAAGWTNCEVRDGCLTEISRRAGQEDGGADRAIPARRAAETIRLPRSTKDVAIRSPGAVDWFNGASQAELPCGAGVVVLPRDARLATEISCVAAQAIIQRIALDQTVVRPDRAVDGGKAHGAVLAHGAVERHRIANFARESSWTRRAIRILSAVWISAYSAVRAGNRRLGPLWAVMAREARSAVKSLKNVEQSLAAGILAHVELRRWIALPNFAEVAGRAVRNDLAVLAVLRSGTSCALALAQHAQRLTVRTICTVRSEVTTRRTVLTNWAQLCGGNGANIACKSCWTSFACRPTDLILIGATWANDGSRAPKRTHSSIWTQ